MIRLPPRSTRTDTLFPYTTLFRSDFYQRAAFSRGCDLGGLVNETEWPRPDPLFGIGGGGILFRDCRMPAPDGRKIVLVLAVASLPAGTLLNHHIYDLTGNAENKGAFILSNPVDSEIPMGESLSTLQIGRAHV